MALVTLDPAKIGVMSCNPAIGGLAKGQMVREIDALGGVMGRAADATGIQFKVLNASRGPAVRGPRCQSDKRAYAAEVQRLVAGREGIEVIGGEVESFVVEPESGQGSDRAGQRVRGVRVRLGERHGPSEPSDGCCGAFGSIDDNGKAVALTLTPHGSVVLTTGTFMRGLMHTGASQTPGGRVGEAPASRISEALRGLGLELGRLKTGTPPRLRQGSLDLSVLREEWGDSVPEPFSEMTTGGIGPGNTDGGSFPRLPQVACWITHTDAQIHALIRDNLHRAPMYNGQIDTAGPRYCPSIEDKVVRFADKPSHQVFLEPESLETDTIYCNGISTSLPAEVQAELVRMMRGCAKAEIVRPGYAVEYDTVLPHQIDATGAVKSIHGLFLAGQINGTSGYEEAAAQGLIAGLNAARQARGDAAIRLGRDQAYLGVLMDDLVTKTPVEPYRMFTSRAEHRLLMRADNAVDRLTAKGRAWGLVDDARWRAYQQRQSQRDHLAHWMQHTARDGKRVIDVVRRQDVTVEDVALWLTQSDSQELLEANPASLKRVLTTALADLHYEGYVARQRRDAEKTSAMEHTVLPGAWDYGSLHGLRAEAAQRLTRFRPATLGQAGRLEGVNPTDVMVLAVALRRQGLATPV